MRSVPPSASDCVRCTTDVADLSRWSARHNRKNSSTEKNKRHPARHVKRRCGEGSGGGAHKSAGFSVLACGPRRVRPRRRFGRGAGGRDRCRSGCARPRGRCPGRATPIRGRLDNRAMARGSAAIVCVTQDAASSGAVTLRSPDAGCRRTHAGAVATGPCAATSRSPGIPEPPDAGPRAADQGSRLGHQGRAVVAFGDPREAGDAGGLHRALQPRP